MDMIFVVTQNSSFLYFIYSNNYDFIKKTIIKIQQVCVTYYIQIHLNSSGLTNNNCINKINKNKNIYIFVKMLVHQR